MAVVEKFETAGVTDLGLPYGFRLGQAPLNVFCNQNSPRRHLGRYYFFFAIMDTFGNPRYAVLLQSSQLQRKLRLSIERGAIVAAAPPQSVAGGFTCYSLFAKYPEGILQGFDTGESQGRSATRDGSLGSLRFRATPRRANAPVQRFQTMPE